MEYAQIYNILCAFSAPFGVDCFGVVGRHRVRQANYATCVRDTERLSLIQSSSGTVLFWPLSIYRCSQQCESCLLPFLKMSQQPAPGVVRR